MSVIEAQQRMCHNKKRYFDETSALIVAAKRTYSGEQNKLRAYQCPLCKGWHLTKR